VTPYLENNCGFTNVVFIPIDSTDNLNIHSKYEDIKWFHGPYLMEMLNTVKTPKRDPDGPLRIPVIDKFKDSGQFYLYGKL
jgi:peptide chain release factor subunit 3